MSIQKGVLDKYSKKEGEILHIKNIITTVILNNTGVIIKNKEIDVKEKSATIQVSSVIKSIVFEKKIEIEAGLREKKSQVIHIQ